jgi:hypothetical protein
MIAARQQIIRGHSAHPATRRAIFFSALTSQIGRCKNGCMVNLFSEGHQVKRRSRIRP